MRLWFFFFLAAPLAYGALELPPSCAGVVAAIIDPYGSSFHQKAEVEKRGGSAIAVMARSTVPIGYRFDATQWKTIFVYDDADAVAEKVIAEYLARGGRQLIVPDGAESGTVKGAQVRDALRRRGFALVGNTSQYAWAHRDKVESAQLLGELAPPSIATTNVEQALDAAEKLGYPVVLKLNRAAGGAGFHKCTTAQEVVDAFAEMGLGQRENPMLEEDTFVVVQRQLRGREQAFNGFRRPDGTVHFSGVWEYERDRTLATSPGYIADRLANPRKRRYAPLLSRVEEGLERLEVVGNFHVETLDGWIIDVGARLSGGGLPRVERASGSRDPFRMSVDGFLDPQLLAGTPRLYDRNRYGAAVFIASEGNARLSLRMVEHLEEWKELGLLVGYDFAFPEDAVLERTVDANTVVGTILINAPTKAHRERLITTIRSWQQQKLFEKPL